MPDTKRIGAHVSSTCSGSGGSLARKERTKPAPSASGQSLPPQRRQPPKRTRHTPFILLRPYRESDLKFLFDLRNDPDIQRKLLFPVRPVSRAEVAHWVETREKDPAGAFLIIAVVHPDQPIGFIQLANIEDKTGEAGLCIAPAFQNKGCGPMAVQLLHQYARDSFGLTRLIARVGLSNQPSINMCRRAGWKPYGILMDYHLMNG